MAWMAEGTVEKTYRIFIRFASFRKLTDKSRLVGDTHRLPAQDKTRCGPLNLAMGHLVVAGPDTEPPTFFRHPPTAVILGPREGAIGLAMLFALPSGRHPGSLFFMNTKEKDGHHGGAGAWGKPSKAPFSAEGLGPPIYSGTRALTGLAGVGGHVRRTVFFRPMASDTRR